MGSPPTSDNREPQVVFRPSKKRKQFLRQRAEDNDVPVHEPTSQPPAQERDPSPHDGENKGDLSEEGLSVAEALRLRNARKSRPKGVEFRPEGAPKEEAPTEHSLIPKDDATGADALEFGMSRRFAPQAGLVGELVNKHMEEYIESELARRHAADKAAAEAAAANAQQAAAAAQLKSIDPTKKVGDGPTLLGRLQEVDLGDEVRKRNAAMTEQARRRLAGEAVDEDSEGSRKRVRVGKDGKPWRSRKRRPSDAMKRDQLVEELMRENKLDVYDVPAQSDPNADPGADEAADERIAEEFRREFMDAMQQRRNQRRRLPAPPPKPGAKQEEILRGPKLGGSRNARAAMRDILLSQQTAQKKDTTRKRR